MRKKGEGRKKTYRAAPLQRQMCFQSVRVCSRRSFPTTPSSTSHLARFGFNIQFLDALPRHKGLQPPCPSDAGVGGGEGAALEAFKQLVLLLVPGRRAEGDGFHLGGGPHVELVL